MTHFQPSGAAGLCLLTIGGYKEVRVDRCVRILLDILPGSDKNRWIGAKEYTDNISEKKYKINN